MQMRHFEVNKSDISNTRVVTSAIPSLLEGEILTQTDRFALTANNISYAIVGEKLGYWNFFPTEEGWGIIPVWGFAEVVESKHPDVKKGERLYGYWPMGTHLVIRPGKLRDDRLSDISEHRAALSPVYNAYIRTQGETLYEPAMDDDRMLLMPLYATSFCLYDFLQDNEKFGASQIVIPSASSKTAIGLAYALKDDPEALHCVGITSTGNKAKVKALGLYDDVITYDNLDALDSSKATVIVDMSGNGDVLSDLHALLGDNMKFTSNVGLTHYDSNKMGPHFIRERSAMFFAPGHIQKRAKEWGPGEFDKKAIQFWHAAALKSRAWLNIENHQGMEALAKVFADVRDSKVKPDTGIIVTPS